MRACSRTESWTICCEVLVGPVASGEADQREPRRQQAAVGEVVDRRHELLAGEVAGDAEDHQAAGPGDARQPPVARVAQRVVRGRPDAGAHGRPQRPAAGRAASSAVVTLARSCSHEATNFSTPSSSSTSTTSSRSMPAAVRAARAACAAAYSGTIVSPSDVAVVADRVERRLGHRVDHVGGHEVDDVAGVGVRRVLDAGRGPQRTLHVRTRRRPAPASASPPASRVNASCATRALAMAAVPRSGGVGTEPLVDLGVDAADEERRHRLDASTGRGRSPAPARARTSQASSTAAVALDGEDQGDVDADAGAEHGGDRRQALDGRRDLDEHVGPVDRPVQRLGLGDRGRRVARASRGSTSMLTRPSTPPVRSCTGASTSQAQRTS